MRRILFVALLLVSACRSFQPARTSDGALIELAPKDFPSFADDLDYAELDKAIASSMEYYAHVLKENPNATMPFGSEQVTVVKAAQSLTAFRAIVDQHPSAAELRKELAESFRVFQVSGDDSDRDVLVTGYYLPEVHGAWHKSPPFTVPVYGLPHDLVVVPAADYPQLQGDNLVGRLSGHSLTPYYTRAEIEAGALNGKGLELLWLDSPLDEFFLEIQGSGIVRFRDGSTRVLTYAGKNGRPYAAIGQELVRRGALKKEDLSMQSIRAWLQAHPADRDSVLNVDQSEVFFRLSPQAEGSLGTPVTAGRTMATDVRVFPKGAIAFVESQRPESATSDNWRKFSRFVLDQDTGGSIRTAAHVDLFWGSGDYAAVAAGHMRQQGKVYYLLAK